LVARSLAPSMAMATSEPVAKIETWALPLAAKI
jgi:hypothetical protein